MSHSVNRRKWNRNDGHGRTQARAEPNAMNAEQEGMELSEVHLLNYSRGGMDVHTPFEPHEGDRVQVRLEGTGMRPAESVPAHVCWVSGSGDNGFDAGLAFERPLSWSGY